jgi:hypothetical protein
MEPEDLCEVTMKSSPTVAPRTYLLSELGLVAAVVPHVLHVVQVFGAVVVEAAHVVLVQLVQHVFGQRHRGFLLGVLLPVHQLKHSTCTAPLPHTLNLPRSRRR